MRSTFRNFSGMGYSMPTVKSNSKPRNVMRCDGSSSDFSRLTTRPSVTHISTKSSVWVAASALFCARLSQSSRYWNISNLFALAHDLTGLITIVKTFGAGDNPNGRAR